MPALTRRRDRIAGSIAASECRRIGGHAMADRGWAISLTLALTHWDTLCPKFNTGTALTGAGLC